MESLIFCSVASVIVLECLECFGTLDRAGEMAQQVKALASKTDDLTSVPRAP